jgi:hypothetical protein
VVPTGIKESTMNKLRHWTPAAFCAFLCLMVLVMQIAWGEARPWSPPFYCFLPMCFYFVGMKFAEMQVEINALHQQLADLNAK